MTHDVFISYSSKDKPIADGVCANLEAEGIRCWIAPRDIAPGEDWPTAITKAISKSRIMVLVFSASSNSSEEVGRELILASNSKLIIIPFKIENVEPEPGKQYYLARTHWLDAMNPPTKDQIAILVDRVKSILPATDPVDTYQTERDRVPQSPPPSRSVLKARRLRWKPAWMISALVILGLFAWFVMDKVLPSFQSQYVFQDDFSNETSGWDVSTDKVAEKYYKNGEYFIHILPGYSSNFSYAWSLADIEDMTDVVIEVDARYIEGWGAYGVIVNYQRDDYFHFFEIEPNGSWDLVQMTSRGGSDLIKWQASPAILTGNAVNHLRFELSHSPTLYVNDQLVSSMSIPYGKGGIGLWATAWDGREFEVAFDNFKITPLP